jgi:hypothetical protein
MELAYSFVSGEAEERRGLRMVGMNKADLILGQASPALYQYQRYRI